MLREGNCIFRAKGNAVNSNKEICSYPDFIHDCFGGRLSKPLR